MKKALFLFLLSLLTTWVPCGVAIGYVDSDGVIGEYADSDKGGSAGGVTGGCDFAKAESKNKGCTDTGIKKGECRIILIDDIKSANGNPAREKMTKNGLKYEVASCVALTCSEGYLLHLYSDGRSRGVCRSYKYFAEPNCKTNKELKKKCEKKHQIPKPALRENPNDPTDKKGAYSGCDCAAENPVTYECGEGTGTPPIDTQQYTNVDNIIAKNNTCKKTGYHFKNWLCGNKEVPEGGTFNIIDDIICVAQWEKNEYSLEYKCDTGTDAVKTEEKLYNDKVTVPGYNAACKKDGSKFTNWVCGGNAYKANQTFNITSDTTCVAQWESCEQCDASEGCDCELYVENNICKYKTTPQEGYYIKSGEKTKSPQCGLADAKKCTDSGGLWVNGECKCNPDVPGTYWDIQNKKCVCTDQNTEYDTTQQKCIAKCNTDVADPDGNGGCICRDRDRIYKDGVCECPPGKPENNEGQCVEPTKCPEGTGTPPGCTCSKDSEKYIEATNSCEPRCNESVATWNGTECECNETGKTYYPNDIVSQSKCECPPDKPDYEGGQCILLERCPDYAPGDNYPDGCVCKDETKTYNTNTGKCDPKCNEEIATWNGSECVCKEKTKEYHENTTDVSLSTCECKDGEREYDDNPGKCETLRTCPEDADGTYPDCECKDEDMKYDPVKNKCVVDELKKKQKEYEEAKAKEQSKENRTLTALSVAATGIGGMELAMGLSQQAADADADQSMAAYLATMRCTYGNDVQVRAGPDEIELPGGNNSDLMSLRSEYFALALDLKERKEALGMKPGIESEEIIDKAQTGLYDDESLSIESGAYASLYRAQMLGSEADQAKIDEERKASKNRVIAGGVLVGAGVVGGMIGDSIINGKLGEKIKAKKAERKAKSVSSIDTEKVISNMSLEEIKQLAKKYNINLETSDLN